MRTMRLPAERGPLSSHVITTLRSSVHHIDEHPDTGEDPLSGDDFLPALYLC